MNPIPGATQEPPGRRYPGVTEDRQMQDNPIRRGSVTMGQGFDRETLMRLANRGEPIPFDQAIQRATPRPRFSEDQHRDFCDRAERSGLLLGLLGAIATCLVLWAGALTLWAWAG